MALKKDVQRVIDIVRSHESAGTDGEQGYIDFDQEACEKELSKFMDTLRHRPGHRNRHNPTRPIRRR